MISMILASRGSVVRGIRCCIRSRHGFGPRPAPPGQHRRCKILGGCGLHNGIRVVEILQIPGMVHNSRDALVDTIIFAIICWTSWCSFSKHTELGALGRIAQHASVQACPNPYRPPGDVYLPGQGSVGHMRKTKPILPKNFPLGMRQSLNSSSLSIADLKPSMPEIGCMVRPGRFRPQEKRSASPRT